MQLEFLNWGTKNKPDYLQKKIILTNQIGIVLFFSVSPMAVMSFFLDLPKVFPVSGFFVSIFYLFFPLFNLKGGHYITRVIVSVLPVCFVTICHAIMISANEPPIASLFVIAFTFLAFCFVVFDYREFGFIVPIFIVNALWFIFFDEVNALIEIPMDNSAIKIGWVTKINISLGLAMFMVVLLLLQSSFKNSEKKNAAFIKEIEDQKNTITQSEEKLKESLNKVELSREEDKKRNWVSSGLGEINDLLRSDSSLDNLYDPLLSKLVKYLNANQARLFVANKKDGLNYLQLKSCYAYNRKKFIDQEIEEGEGLVGQVFLEKETLKLTEIPKEYISITSGLGEAVPKDILIIPLKINEKVEGVLEIASFRILEEYQQEFLERVGETMAAAIGNHRMNKQTKNLLETSQMQSEELRRKEEEMRQNYEELQATQEQADRRANEIEMVKNNLAAKLDVLDKIALISESDLYGNITYVNDVFCKTAQYSREEIIGKPHNIIRHPDTPKEIFKEMWATIKAGKVFNQVIKNRARDGSSYWVNAYVSPVLDENGKPKKYIGIRFDITKEMDIEKKGSKNDHIRQV
ncbi:PAS domain-containing protein [Flexithrix dorotheae]|uniref:PAS domain-containing protein n=1 Tax=Flexithrix dorotheae TaxID=70993 RepID=UPI00037A08BD|nr:PAS domain-containing protein [Flexithrix dorotheae]